MSRTNYMNNMTFKDCVNLKLNNTRLESSNTNSYFMYGRHAAIAALQNPLRKIEKIFCTKLFLETNKNISHKNKLEIVDNEFLNKILGHNQNHQGIAVKLFSIFAYDL
ncbi:MAG: RNA methyltransferase substrate-binding domain-containing protein, partial [Janthinobacterium lividum]